MQVSIFFYSLNSAEFGDDEENESCSGELNAYNFHTSRAICTMYNVHACKCNVHKCACTFLYSAIVLNSAEIFEWWRKWNFLRRVKCMLTTMFNISKEYVHACKPYEHKCACTFLSFSIALKQLRDGEDNESFSGGPNVYSTICALL